jgi:hypothetical protein
MTEKRSEGRGTYHFDLSGACKSVRRGQFHCADGFPQSSACVDPVNSDKVPCCCDEARCGELFPITGEPWKERETEDRTNG